MDTPNTELIRSHVDTIILCTLLDGDSYPYEILKQISDKTESRYELKQATLYSCMKRLEKQGLVSSYWGTESSGGRRRYYSLTDEGRKFVERDQNEWEYSRTIINKLLSEKEFDLINDEAPFDASALRPMTKRNSAVDTVDNSLNIEDQDLEISQSEQNCDTDAIIENSDTLPTSDESNAELESNQNINFTNTIDESNITNDYNDSNIQYVEIKNDDNQDLASATADSIDAIDHPSTTDSVFIADDQTTPFSLESTGSQDDNESLDSEMYMDSHQNISNANDYIKKLDDLYTEELREEKTEQTQKISTIQFNDLKNKMLQEGYHLRLYSRHADVSRKTNQYIYSNKLNRDTYLILSIPLIILTILAYCLNIYQSLAINVLLGIGVCLVPLTSLIVFLLNKDKRVKNTYFFMYDLIFRLVIAIIAIIIVLVICFTIKDLNISTISISISYAVTIPLVALIKMILLKTKKYFV